MINSLLRMPTDTNTYCVHHHMNQNEKTTLKKYLKRSTSCLRNKLASCFFKFSHPTKTFVYACRHKHRTDFGFCFMVTRIFCLFVSCLQLDQDKYKSLKRNLKINDPFERDSCRKCVTASQQRLERAWVCLAQV